MRLCDRAAASGRRQRCLRRRCHWAAASGRRRRLRRCHAATSGQRRRADTQGQRCRRNGASGRVGRHGRPGRPARPAAARLRSQRLLCPSLRPSRTAARLHSQQLLCPGRPACPGVARPEAAAQLRSQQLLLPQRFLAHRVVPPLETGRAPTPPSGCSAHHWQRGSGHRRHNKGTCAYKTMAFEPLSLPGESQPPGRHQDLLGPRPGDGPVAKTEPRTPASRGRCEF